MALTAKVLAPIPEAVASIHERPSRRVLPGNSHKGKWI